MTTNAYKKALAQAKADLAARNSDLGKAQDVVEKAEKDILELRQTIAALQRLCGEHEFIEEDSLGLTDAIRMVFRSEFQHTGTGMSAHDVRARLESMGYSGRWGNVLASIHTVIKRLLVKRELEAVGNLNGRETFRWAGSNDPWAALVDRATRPLGVEAASIAAVHAASLAGMEDRPMPDFVEDAQRKLLKKK